MIETYSAAIDVEPERCSTSARPALSLQISDKLLALADEVIE